MSPFFLVGAALTVGFALIVALALSGKKRGRFFQPEFSLSRDQFEKLAVALLEEMKLDIQERESVENQTDLLVRNPTPIVGGFLLVRCLYTNDPRMIIEATAILEFSNLILQERLSKGILMTTGRLTPDLPGLGELAPIEFIDGDRFLGLLQKYRLAVPQMT